MIAEDGELVASFVATADDRYWNGAIYAMHDGLGPELLSVCGHDHEMIQVALDCAENDLRFARRVVELADQYAGARS